MREVNYKKYTPCPTKLPMYDEEFRSILEARWFYAFYRLGIKCYYEPKAYNLPSGWYLPDGYMPNVNGGLWVEIKPAVPGDDQIQRYVELVKETGKSILLLTTAYPYQKGCGVQTFDEPGHFIFDGTEWKLRQGFCRCTGCGDYGVTTQSNPKQMVCECNRGHNDYAKSIRYSMRMAKNLKFTQRRDGFRRIINTEYK